MSTPVEARHALYARLRHVLGDVEATTMIDILGHGSEDLATKADVARLDDRMDGLDHRMDGLDHRMDRLEDRIENLHHALREQTRTYVLASYSSALLVGSLAFAAARLV